MVLYVYSHYRCSNPGCAKSAALPEGLLGSQAGKTTGAEPIALACSNCNCVCSCEPIGTPQAFPEEQLSKRTDLSYEALWLQCDEPSCTSRTRLLIPTPVPISAVDLAANVKAMPICVGLACALGHPISQVRLRG